MADARLLQNISAQAAGWLAVGCVCFVMLAEAYTQGYLTKWMSHPAHTWDYSLYQVIASANTWAWVLAIFGFGMRRLNFSNAALEYAGEIGLPFYILHQTVLFSIAFVVVQLPVGILGKFLLITLGAFLATISIYECVVRRSSALRIVFGMKPRRRAARES